MISYSYAIIFALASLLGIGSSDFLYKMARSGGATPEAFLLLQAVFFNLTDVAALLLTHQQMMFTITLIISGLSEAVMLYAAFLIFITSLKAIDVSSGAPIFRLNFLITSLLAYIMLGEKFGITQLLGSVFSILAIIFFSWRGGSSFAEVRNIVMTLVAMILYGLSGFVYKVALGFGINPVALITMQGLSFITIAFLYSAYKGKLTFSKAEVSKAPFCGVLLSFSLIVLNEALKLQPVNIIYPISQLSFTFTSVLGFIILGEKLDAYKLLGIISAMVAVVTLAL
ncbi:MAG: DMT family transporter [Nitrososphaerota archaeon]